MIFKRILLSNLINFPRYSYRFFCLFVFIFSASFIHFVYASEGNFAIREWQEFTKINETGRLSNAIIKGVSQNLAPGYMLRSYTVAFPNSRRIKILEAKIDGKKQQFKFENNVFTIEFLRGKANRDLTEISFTYQETNLRADQGIRQEIISIPEIAKGASFLVAIDYGDSLELVSGQENLTIKNGVSLLTGTVPDGGISKLLKFARKSDGWNIRISNNISFNEIAGEMIIVLPQIFENGGQKILSRTSNVNIKPLKSLFEEGKRTMYFDITSDFKGIYITENVSVLTGESFRTKITRQDPSSYTYLPSSDEELLTTIIERIKGDPSYKNMPLYVKLAKFTNNYIKYDKSYYGKLLNVVDILREKKGVCSEFATLYNALARAAKIPSSIVYGYALGEYEKFEPHAWNMVFVDNQWKQIDPTWDLTAGVVSSSHIFLKDDFTDDIVVKFKGHGDGDIKLEKIVDIKPMKGGS